MQQLEIKFFWPLTEQIPLDLDFTPCEEYEREKAHKRLENSFLTSGTVLMTNGTGLTTWATITNNTDGRSMTIDIDNYPITIVSKEKPGFLKAYLYKILGVKWKSK